MTDIDERLATERNIWLATVRPNGSPHLTPIWFTWVAGRMYVCTVTTSVKTRNVRAERRISFSLESGDQPVVGEGTVEVLAPPFPQPIVDAFVAKFQWDINTPDEDGPYDALWEITVTRWLMGGAPAG